MTKKNTPTTANKTLRPPIVAVLGHVDHGKTTLLDTIRKSNVAARESGGITQHIGAYQIVVGKDNKKITFIDTPGHEAFTKMRSRGAEIADFAILVVAATDGVQPQTIESIKIIKAANIPIIVALNKTDLPEADADKVKQQLAKHEVLVEGFGGDVVLVPVSAKTGKGVPELLDVILLLSEMREVSGDPNAPLTAIIVEAKQDKHRGPLATVIVKTGTLKVGQTVYAESVTGRVRNLRSDTGESVVAALPSTPVEIMGWQEVPPVGATVSETKSQTLAPAETRAATYDLSLPQLDETKKLKLILKTDVAGSLEAIKANLPKNVELVATGVGEVMGSDVLLAKSTGAFIIGFNTKAGGSVTKLAQLEKVRIKFYTLIYQLLEELTEVIELLNEPAAQDQTLGEAKILAEFMSGTERIAGCRVSSGRIARGDLVKIMRTAKEIGRARVKTMKQGKSDAPKTEMGGECGVVFDKKLDFKIGDLIIAYKIHELLA